MRVGRFDRTVRNRGETTSLKVLRDNELLYDRDQAFGGAQLTQLISRQYGFSFEEAETKKLAGDLPEDFQETILGLFVDSLSQEIGRALAVFLYQYASPQGALRDAGWRHSSLAGPEKTA